MTPEFSRTFRLDELGGSARSVHIQADEAERAALAVRFGLIAIDRLEAAAELIGADAVVTASGQLRGDVVQSCVASGEPVPARIDEPFSLRFEPDAEGETEEERELAEDDLDVIGYTGGAVDLGEAVAQTLALALDPFPRAPEADNALRQAGVMGEEDASPFAVLKALKDKL